MAGIVSEHTSIAALLAAALVSCGAPQGPEARAAAPSAAVALNPPQTYVQLFRWRWNDIAKECRDFLGPRGFGAVQISPPQAHKAAGAWWDVYQPVNYRNLTSDMGNAADLGAMIAACHQAGVRVYADVVINHLATGSGTATDGSSYDGGVPQYPFFGPQDFHSACDIQDGDYNGNRSRVVNCRLVGLPDLATDGSYVRGQLAAYLNGLRDLGIDGFRVDAAKHMWAADIQAILQQVNRTTLLGEPLFVTQEIIPDGTVNRGDYLANGTINEFQFTYAVRDAFRGNNGLGIAQLPSIMGTGNGGGSWGLVTSDQATIFVDNHDTERHPGDSLNLSSDNNKRFDLANVYMLAQPYGRAQLQSGFTFSFSYVDQDAPTASPYDAAGNPVIMGAWDFVHRWADLYPVVAFRSAVAGQAMTRIQTGNDNQLAFARGNVGFVALNNDGSTWSRTFSTGLPPGTYCNVVHGLLDASGTGCSGDAVTVDGSGNASLSVGPVGGASVPAVVIYTGQKVSGGGCASVPVTFTIANAGTVWGQNLYVVGNLPALGNWAPASSFALTIQGSGANVPWSGTVQLPPGTAFQYKYVKYNPSTGAVVWESDQATPSHNRERTTAACGGANSFADGSFKM